MKTKTKTGSSRVEMVIKVRVNSELYKWMDNKRACRELSNVTSKALEFYYDYLFTRKGFFIRLIDLHFEEIKHLLRKIGRYRKF